MGKRCSEDHNQYKNDPKLALHPPFEPTKESWNISNDDLDYIAQVCKSQLPSLYGQAFQGDKALLTLLSIGYKNDVPYFSFLVDSFLRDRAIHAHKTEQVLKVSKWTNMNGHSTYLKKEVDKNACEQAQAAIQSYFKRICTPLTMKNDLIISDALDQVAGYILAMIDLVHNLT